MNYLKRWVFLTGRDVEIQEGCVHEIAHLMATPEAEPSPLPVNFAEALCRILAHEPGDDAEGGMASKEVGAPARL